MKCNKTLSKWCKNKHGASKIIDTFETYQCSGGLQPRACIHLHDADRKASNDRLEGRQRRPTRLQRQMTQTGKILEASDAGRQLSDRIRSWAGDAVRRRPDRRPPGLAFYGSHPRTSYAELADDHPRVAKLLNQIAKGGSGRDARIENA
jgi:hypothetical protein